MKSDKIIVLLTNSYPYGYGESFLETEINYLANAFKHVYILPFRSESRIRKLPDNVSVITCLNQTSRFLMVLNYGHRVLLSKDFWNEFKILNFKKKVLNFFKIFVLLCKSYYIKDSIEKFVNNENLEYSHIIFYTYWLTSAAYGISLIIKQHPVINLISRAHGYDLYSERHQTDYIPMQYKTISRLKKLFLISHDGYEYLSRKYEDDKKIVNRLHISRLGVKKGFPAENNSKPESMFRIVTCSNLIKVKRLDILVLALSILETKKIKKIEWHHIGEGREKKRIERMAKKHLSRTVSYQFHGALTNQQVLDFYKNTWFDLFINVSDSEGLPVTIMEAFSYGIPVLARNVGGISEAVNNNNGLLLDSLITPETLAEVLLKVIESPDDILLKRQAALDTWNALFNSDNNYKQFIKSINCL